LEGGILIAVDDGATDMSGAVPGCLDEIAAHLLFVGNCVDQARVSVAIVAGDFRNPLLSSTSLDVTRGGLRSSTKPVGGKRDDVLSQRKFQLGVMGGNAISVPEPGGLFQPVRPSEGRDTQKSPHLVMGVKDLNRADRLHGNPWKLVGVGANNVNQSCFALVDRDRRESLGI